MSLTQYVAEFVVDTPVDAIPPAVRALGKRSILDGLGLALAGQAAETGRILQEYLRDLGCTVGPSTVIGSRLRTAPRFAALANGVAIHADDYDDTQLAVAKDRVYGLLAHPTAPVLPAVLAQAERGGRSGIDLLTAYLVGVEVACKVAEIAIMLLGVAVVITNLNIAPFQNVDKQRKRRVLWAAVVGSVIACIVGAWSIGLAFVPGGFICFTALHFGGTKRRDSHAG